MQITIEIPENLPKEMAIREIRELEKKFRKDAEFLSGETGVYNNNMKNHHPVTAHHIDEKHILQKLKRLVQEGSISEARILLASIPHIKSPGLDNWHKTLSLPKVKQKKTATGRSQKEDAAWLHNNALNYHGKWVALKQGKLMGSHESQIELYRSLKQSGRIKGVMLIKLEKKIPLAVRCRSGTMDLD